MPNLEKTAGTAAGIAAVKQIFWQRGFTLIEILVTISIAAILTALAAPSFNNAVTSNKLAGFANSFVASAQLARSESIKRNSVVRVCHSANGTACATSGEWQQGWIVFNDVDNDSAVDTGETVIQVQQSLSADYNFTGDSYNMAFQPTGGVPSLVTLNLCRARPSAGREERSIRVTLTGRLTVTKTTTGVCS